MRTDVGKGGKEAECIKLHRKGRFKFLRVLTELVLFELPPSPSSCKKRKSFCRMIGINSANMGNQEKKVLENVIIAV